MGRGSEEREERGKREGREREEGGKGEGREREEEGGGQETRKQDKKIEMKRGAIPDPTTPLHMRSVPSPLLLLPSSSAPAAQYNSSLPLLCFLLHLLLKRKRS